MPRPHQTDRRPVYRPPAHAPRTLALACPDCTAPVHVGRADLVEGRAVRCPRCGAEPELTHEFDDAAGRTVWSLVDPRADYPDEPL